MKTISCLCLLASILLAGCGKEDMVNKDSDPVLRIENRTFSSEDVYLETSYYSHGSVIDQVKMRPQDKLVVTANENNEGYITFTSDDFDLSDVTGIPKTGKLPRLSFLKFGKDVSIPATFVPCSDNSFSCDCELDTLGMHISLSLYFIEGKVRGKYYQYSKSSESDYFYSNINWTMYDEPNSESYNFMDIPMRDEGLHYASFPFIISWDSATYPDDIRSKIAPVDILHAILDTPFLRGDDYGFNESGDILLSISTLAGRLCSGLLFYDLHNSPLQINPTISWYSNFFKSSDGVYIGYGSFDSQMRVYDIKNTTFKIFIDPQGLFTINVPKTLTVNSSDGFSELTCYPTDTLMMKTFVYNLISAVSPANVDGILMNYEFGGPDDEYGKPTKFKMSFADQKLAKAFMKALMLPLLKDKANYDRLLEAWRADEVIAPYFENLKYLVDNLETLLENTTEINFGWSYSRGVTMEENSMLGLRQYEWLYPD